MHKIRIKPLSVNQAWIGKLKPTSKWKTYKRAVPYLLPPLGRKFDPECKLKLTIRFGFSSKASDIDNPLKPFVDCLQEKYGFDDKQIYELIVYKDLVKKKEEYVEFDIEELL